MTNPIQTENQLLGTTAWLMTNGATTQIQGYCDQLSYNPGDTVTFYVSVQVNGTTWSGGIYRVGWYGGAGGRLIATIPTQTGVAQGYWDNTGNTLNGMSGVGSISIGPFETGWAASYTWQIPANTTSGVYEALITDQNGKQLGIKWLVKSPSPADYLVVFPDTTDAAYNPWGGNSLYSNVITGTSIPAGAGLKVSFNRPYVQSAGYGINLLNLCINPIKWMERQGYNLAYCSILDIHTGAVSLDNYSAVIHLGHSEYWTKEMYDACVKAVSHGVGMGFFGANPIYWQCRLENNLAGTVANRTVTVYRVRTGNSNLNLDPFYGVDNTRVTSLWRDPVLNRPESAFAGVGFLDTTPTATTLYPWAVDGGASGLSVLAGTGLVPGRSYGADLVGFEFDYTDANSPTNIQVIASSTPLGSTSQPSTQRTTLYQAASGAYVFAAGSHQLALALDTYRLTFNGTPYQIPEIQALFANVLALLVQGKAGTMAPRGLASFATFHT